MDANPYQAPTTANESPSRTEITLVEGLAYCLGWVAFRTIVFVFFAAAAIALAMLMSWLE
jgi:hypothetical protein